MNNPPDLPMPDDHLDWDLRLHEWLDGAAGAEDAAAMQAHMAGCALCTESAQALRRLDERLATTVPPEPGLSSAFDEQLFARISAEEAARAQVRARAQATAPAADLAALEKAWRASLLKIAAVAGVLMLLLAWAIVSGPLQSVASPASLAVAAASVSPLQWIMVGLFGAAAATLLARWLNA
jgi:anti-sigma factor RsiW